MAVSAELKQHAAALNAIAKDLLDRRTLLSLQDLIKEKNSLLDIKLSVSSQLSGKQQDQFYANMEKVEDSLDTLIRKAMLKKDASSSFIKEVRKLNKHLQATATVIWSLAILFLSLHPQP